MTDSGNQRPRRAFASDDAQPDGHDDTRSAPSRRARRVADEDFAAPPSAASSPSKDSPFAVPASETAIPAPVLPSPEYEAETASSVTSGWESLTVPPTPGRRSAAEPSTAAEPATASQPNRHRRKAKTQAAPSSLAEADETVDVTNDDQEAASSKSGLLGPDSWLSHHKRTLMLAMAGGLAAIVLIAGGFFLVSRLGQGNQPSAAATPSVSISPIEVTESSLITVEDAAQIESSAQWAITETTNVPAQITRRAACLGADPADINPITAMQRTLGAAQPEGLALMHQIDVYASEEAAQQVYDSRVAGLTECNQVPALLIGASTVEGLGDQVTQVSVAFQNESTQYHTVLLVRSGRTLQLIDVSRTDSATAADPVVASSVRSLTEVCGLAGSTCPTTPVVTATPPLAADPVGWLIPSDLPRITPGHGFWNALSQPVDVTVRGSGCENMPLATEPGPSNRMQHTLVMTGDPAAPTGMGVDEVLFSFEDEQTATSFADRLAGNIASCADVAATATVAELEAASGTGVSETPVAARLFNISQQTADDAATYFQVAVVQAGTKVSYLLATVGQSYQFSEPQLAALGIRAGQRATQG